MEWISIKIGRIKLDEKEWFPVLCEKCHWQGSSQHCTGGDWNGLYGDEDYYCPKCGFNGPGDGDELYDVVQLFLYFIKKPFVWWWRYKEKKAFNDYVNRMAESLKDNPK